MTRYLNLLFLLCLFASCEKSDTEISPTDGLRTLSSNKVEATVGGQVLDQNDEPVSGAQVFVGEFSTYTNEEGFFLFSSLELPEQGANLRLKVPGYFPYATWLYPGPQSKEFVDVKLLELEVVDRFSAGAGTQFQRGVLSVTLPPNGYIFENGDPYAGEVSLALVWLDAADPLARQQLPGSMLGFTTEAEFAALLQTGVLGVELYATDGQELQLAAGKTANLSLPLPEAFQGGVQSERSLWYLDESTGLWQEEGTARWENGVYEATVSHFTFWCCSPSYPAVLLSGRLQTALGEAVPFRSISMEVLPTGLIEGGVRSRADGSFSGFAPVDEQLRMIIWDACGEVAFSEDLGSFSQNTNIGTFTVDNDQYYQYTGQALDCSGGPLENAFVTASWNGQNQTILSDAAGNFRGGMYLCTGTTNAPFEIRMADVNAGLISDWLSQELAQNMDVGPQVVCELPAEDFIEVNCVDETRLFLTPSAGGYYGSDLMAVWDSIYLPNQAPMHLDISVAESAFSAPGTSMDINGFRYEVTATDGTYWVLGCGSWGSEPCSGMSIEILENAGPGSYLHGTWSGTVSASARVDDEWQTPTMLDVSGRFRVLQE